ncbi:hypothetical protein BCV69DRAFT_131793 [Microstroma glucosiphilum]|uniref:Uncharacterized protein n=1 Tax=Pseudomicrostroma glucosiphilum TaxID=1684307 RepID=A0A316UA23_9BASI|nr:hypothetical protein BCV69DRAFT_131793 [Pseudomicrostroma glucosiphilum]PWN22080.1 hypothetical protein BCV69DRAFT_131793 [Pseudomicrostroma glucosiphilum]
MNHLGDLDGSCQDYLTAAMHASTPPSAALSQAVFGVGVVCTIATLCGPVLYVLQWRRGTLWFFQLKRTSRGTYIACHPLNVFLLNSILCAACISILGIFTKASENGHMDLIPGLLVLQMLAWVFSGLSAFYLVMGTFIALPEGCDIPGLVRLSRALAPLSHPYVINTFMLCAPVVYTASNIPNIILAPRDTNLAKSLSMVAIERMRGLAMQDPSALIPADVQALLVESVHYEWEAEKHIGIAFVFNTLFTFLLLLIGYPTAYSLVFLLRRQLQEEGKRVRRVPRDNAAGATEKALGTSPCRPGLGVHMITSTDVKVDGPDLQDDNYDVDVFPARQRAPLIAAATSPSRRSTSDAQVGSCPGSPLKFGEPSTPITPQSLAMSLPSSAEDKDLSAFGDVPNLPKAPFVEDSPTPDSPNKPTFLRNMRRRMSWSTRTQSGSDSQRDKTAALLRFKYLRRCFYTLATFYISMSFIGLVYLGLSFFIALVHLLAHNPLLKSISNLMLVFECVAAAALVMNFTLVGVKVFDSGTV